MRRFDRALQRRSFTYLRWRRYFQYAREIRHDLEPLIIYQMGKVGSSSAYESLRRYCPDFQVFQVHVLTPEWIRKVEDQYRAATRHHGRPTLDKHVLASRYLERCLRRDRNRGRRWKVISMVRDPVARNVSAFFQAFPIYFAEEAGRLRDPTLASLGVDRLRTMFFDDFGRERHHVPLTWFQTHFEPVFHLDVYARPFDKASGYQILQGDTCDLLILRTENLRAVLKPAIQRFLGVDLPEPQARNVSSDKSYSSAFDNFTGDFLPETYLDEMYGSPYARHFYADDELRAFRERWSSSVSTNPAKA